jgi:hypothetical protein
MENSIRWGVAHAVMEGQASCLGADLSITLPWLPGRSIGVLTRLPCRCPLTGMQIYASIRRIEQHTGQKVDLLICCGDFQAVRNKDDLQSMNVPSKYLTMVRRAAHQSGTRALVAATLT